MKIAYALVALLALSGVVWMLVNVSAGFRSEASPTTRTASQDTSRNTPEGEPFKGSMQDLVTRGGSYKCVVSMVADGVTTHGTVFTSKRKMRADFSANISQIGNVQTHVIMHVGTAYIWTSMASRGLTFPIQNGAVRASGADADVAATLNQNYDFNCALWSADDSKFDLPSGISF